MAKAAQNITLSPSGFVRLFPPRSQGIEFCMQSFPKAFPLIHEIYPAAAKKFQHSSGVKRSQISPMACMS